MKVKNKRQLRRALMGRAKGFFSSLIMAVIFSAWCIALRLYLPDFPMKWFFCFHALLATVCLFIHGRRVFSGCASVRRLSAAGQLEPAIADFNHSERIIIGDKDAADAVLGERYAFLLSNGKVIPWGDVTALLVEHEEGISFLRLTDRGEHTYLLTDDRENCRVIDRCLEHIKHCCPSCPEAEHINYR